MTAEPLDDDRDGKARSDRDRRRSGDDRQDIALDRDGRSAARGHSIAVDRRTGTTRSPLPTRIAPRAAANGGGPTIGRA